MLQEITRLKIDYLYYLDYVDYNCLSNTNKGLFTLLNNDTTLRNILYKQCDNDINLPPDFPILKSLNELNKEITRFVYNLYPDDMKWPRWVNIELFRNDLKRNIHIMLYNKLSELLHNNGDDILDLNLVIDKMKIVVLSEIELIFPFVAYNDDHYLIDTNIDDNKFYKHFNKELKLSNIILEYFKHYFKYLFDKYSKYTTDIEDKIYCLLFIRDYTYKSLLEV